MSKKQTRQKKDKKNWDKIDILHNISKDYKNLEESIVNQLFFELNNHGTTIGSFREDIWKSLFEQIVPKKFKVERSVFIIDSSLGVLDSKSGISKEVDIAIFDESYTPYIFQYGQIKFIPIEAVAAVVECKSLNRSKSNLKKWVDSIYELKTQSNSIARMAMSISDCCVPTQKSTRPLLINCHKSSEKGQPIDDLFDIVLHATQELKQNGKVSKIVVKINKNKETLAKQFYSLNHAQEYQQKEGEGREQVAILVNNIEKFRSGYGYGRDKKGWEEANIAFKETMQRPIEDYRINKGSEEISLLSLNFILNQLLMLINNPILFPHMAYVKMFNKALSAPNKNERKSENGL